MPFSPRSSVGRVAVGLGLLALVAGGLAAGAADAVDAPPTVATAARIAPRPDHVVVVVMENKNRTSVIGSKNAPYLNALAAKAANMSQSYGVSHPSQTNYVAMFAGAQHNVTTNACTDLGDRPNLATQLRTAGLSFTGYAESMPKAGYTGCASGKYQRKHNGWVSFSNVTPSQNQPFSAFPTDYTKLPTVSFVTPNMCNDMHDCSVGTGDAWLKKNIDPYARWAMTHNSLLVVTFDENQGGTVNQIPTLIVGQKVRPGLYREWMNHYTLLRTIQDAYGLPTLGWSSGTGPLSSIWTTATKPVTGVTNAGFESRAAGWATSGSTYSATSVHKTGQRSIRVGSTKATRGDSIVSQTITVPAGKTRLDVWWMGRCSDSVKKAWATVIVKRNTSHTVSTLLPRTCVKAGTWQKVGVKVTPGNSYTIQLVNHDDGVRKTPNRTYFDAVRLS